MQMLFLSVITSSQRNVYPVGLNFRTNLSWEEPLWGHLRDYVWCHFGLSLFFDSLLSDAATSSWDQTFSTQTREGLVSCLQEPPGTDLLLASGTMSNRESFQGTPQSLGLQGHTIYHPNRNTCELGGRGATGGRALIIITRGQQPKAHWETGM